MVIRDVAELCLCASLKLSDFDSNLWHTGERQARKRLKETDIRLPLICNASHFADTSWGSQMIDQLESEAKGKIADSHWSMLKFRGIAGNVLFALGESLQAADHFR